MADIFPGQAANLDIKVYQISDESFNMSFENPDSSPVDLTGYTFSLNVYRFVFAAPQLLFAVIPSFVGSPTLGVLNVTFTANNLANAGTFSYDLSSDDGNDLRRYWVRGNFTIVPTSDQTT